MKRTWATGSAHDDKPLDWLFDLRHASDVSHITDVIDGIAANEDPAIGEWQTALLVSECVAFLRGAAADLHEDAHAWLQKVRPSVDDEFVEKTLEVVKQAKAGSSLQKWWLQVKPDEMAVWQRAVAYLGRRIKDGADAQQ